MSQEMQPGAPPAGRRSREAKEDEGQEKEEKEEAPRPTRPILEPPQEDPRASPRTLFKSRWRRTRTMT